MGRLRKRLWDFASRRAAERKHQSSKQQEFPARNPHLFDQISPCGTLEKTHDRNSGATCSSPNHSAFGNVIQYPVRKTDRKSTRLNSSHVKSSYAVFCLKKKTLRNAAFRTLGE